MAESEKTPRAPPDLDGAEEAAVLYGRAGVVTLFTLLSRVLGMVRDLTIAHRFGAGGGTDAWVQAFRIPNALRRLTAEGAMTIAFIPNYVRVREQAGAAAGRLFAQRVLGLVLGVTVVLAGLGMIFNGPLTGVFSPGFAAQPEKFALAAELLRWTFPYLVLVSLVAWAMGVLNSEGSFAAPAAAPALLNLGIIGAVVVFSSAFAPPVLAIAAGVLAGGVAQVVLQLPPLLQKGVLPRPRLGWRDPDVRRLLRLLIPSLFGVAVYELNIILLGVIASYLPTGQIFHYHNATRLTELVMGLFAFAFTTAGLPKLSEHHARKDWDRMAETIRFTFGAVLFAILPAMAGLVAAGEAIVAMLFLHGAYHAADVTSTADTLRWLALGMPAVAGVRVMVPIFYAFGDSRTPVAVSAASVVVTVGLGWWLSRTWEVRGLALGLSLGGWFQCATLAVLLAGRAEARRRWFPWRSAWQLALVSAGCAFFAWWAAGFGQWGEGYRSPLNWGVLLLTVGGTAGLYLAASLLLGEPQARHWLTLWKRLAGRSGQQPRGKG
ncbi:MAG: murein biosynthesis integral membrane protein MurJ [bacterium]